MKRYKLGFIGLGLIGGSIARAVRRTMPETVIVAYNRTRASLVQAMQDGVINLASDEIGSGFPDCDYIFLCMPVSRNIEMLPALKAVMGPQCILTDVGSVKSSMHKAVQDCGLSAQFIGGHPMAGSERTGYANSSDRMLENAYYILTPGEGTAQARVQEFTDIVKTIGAIPITVSSEEHDRATAAISHLPHMIAYSLVNYVRENDNEEGLMRCIAAGGFKDITRIASSSPAMWESICLENKAQILDTIGGYREELDRLTEAIRDEDSDFLLDFFGKAKDYRDDMPTVSSGSILPVYELYVDIIDESGAIAMIATVLAINNISIKNIAIVHNREFQEGVLRVEFYNADAVHKARELLEKFSYKVHER